MPDLATRFNRWRYSLYAPFYDGLARVFAPQRRRALQLLAPRPDAPLLLVGAGTGLDLEFIPRACKVHAVDISPAMIDRLRARARRLGQPVEAEVMDVQVLRFADNGFDTAALHLILAVVPDPVACLREVERVLRPGGRAIVFDKFLQKNRRAGLLRASANLVTRLIATDINRRLPDIVAQTGLHLVHEEAAGLNGFFRIALLEKPAARDRA